MNPVEQEAGRFIYNVRQRFMNQPSKFDEFAELLEDIPKCKILKRDFNHLIPKLKNMFANDRHQDLLFGLNNFLPENHKTSDFKIQESDVIHEDGPPPKKKLRKGEYSFLSQYKSPSELFNKIRDRCIEKNDVDFNVLDKFMDVVVSYNKKKINYYEADGIFRELFRDDPDLYVEWTGVLADTLENENSDSGFEFSKRVEKKNDNVVGKKLSMYEEMMADAFERCDSGKSDIRLEFSKRGERKNGKVVGNKLSLYEQMMQLREFYLYETDLIFERIRSVTGILKRNEEKLDEPFTVHDLKYIKRLYHSEDNYESGEMVVKNLQIRYAVSREIVLERLRQKEEQLGEEKLHTMKVWEEIFEDLREKKNVYRHRKFLKKMKKLASGNGKYAIVSYSGRR